MDEREREWVEKMNKREEVMALIDEILASGVSPETIRAELAKAVEEVEHGR